MTKDGEPAEFAFRLALAMVGSTQFELIQPLDDRSMYAEFLAEKGEGLHHIALGVPNYDDALVTVRSERAARAPERPLQRRRFAYVSTDEDLGFITELLDIPPGLVQEPDAVYP